MVSEIKDKMAIKSHKAMWSQSLKYFRVYKISTPCSVLKSYT